MTPLMIAALGLLMIANAFLSGMFGMAGGLILIGVLLALMPLPTAMVLHAITQKGRGFQPVLFDQRYTTEGVNGTAGASPAGPARPSPAPRRPRRAARAPRHGKRGAT